MKIEHYKNGKKIGKVSHKPDFVLRRKGCITAKKSPSSCDAFCQKLVSRCSAFENKEVIQAEELLHDIRREGATLLATVVKSRSTIKDTPSAVPENSPIDTRENIRNASKKATANAEAAAALRRLCEIYEQTINIDLTLDERIKKTRHLCEERLHVFVMGVRNKVCDYSFTPEFSDSAIESYYKRHYVEDKAIEGCVSDVYKEFIKEDK